MASTQRRLQILTRLLGGGEDGLETRRLCEVCRDVIGVTGAGIMLMAGDIPRGSVCTTNEVSALIEELQYTFGEGPCVDAYEQDRPVLEPDLAHPVTPRWLAFIQPALDAGARAVFGFPLQVGAGRLGALNLYSDRAGPLTDDQYADAVVMAGIAAQTILMVQAKAPPGALAVELEAGADFHFGVHQAAGMVSVQLDVSVTQALIRLRAYAFANGRLVADVASDVLVRRLRFDPVSGGNPPRQ